MKLFTRVFRVHQGHAAIVDVVLSLPCRAMLTECLWVGSRHRSATVPIDQTSICSAMISATLVRRIEWVPPEG